MELELSEVSRALQHKYNRWAKVTISQWPEYSGDGIYPVPSANGSCPVLAYDYAAKWKGEYGNARLRYIAFLSGAASTSSELKPMHKARLRAVLERLQQEGVSNPANLCFGVCYELSTQIPHRPHSHIRRWCKATIQHWLEYSGSGTYPVPHGTMPPEVAFDRTSDLWVGEYGQARQRYIAFLLGALSHA
jgi:hypothetical protein